MAMAIGSNESEEDIRFRQNGSEEDTSTLQNEFEEDTDEMYDDLLQNYGTVVYKSDDKKSPVAEVDDDAECLSFAVAVAKVASDVKAGDIKVLFVKPLVNWTRFFIIATAFSLPQSDAIGSRVKDLAEKQYGKFAKGDYKPSSWTLLDFGDVVLHIFLPEQRALYNLEEFYANAPSIDLPFENQPPFQG
jgi:ribosome silencing factor RsfS/YbeB/iojap